MLHTSALAGLVRWGATAQGRRVHVCDRTPRRDGRVKASTQCVVLQSDGVCPDVPQNLEIRGSELK